MLAIGYNTITLNRPTLDGYLLLGCMGVGTNTTGNIVICSFGNFGTLRVFNNTSKEASVLFVATWLLCKH